MNAEFKRDMNPEGSNNPSSLVGLSLWECKQGLGRKRREKDMSSGTKAGQYPCYCGLALHSFSVQKFAVKH
jgi:hypothetical protein